MSVVYYALCVVRTSLPVKRQNGVLSLPEEMRFWLLVHKCSGTRHCKLFSLVESRNSAIRLAGTVYFAFVLPAFLTEKSPR